MSPALAEHPTRETRVQCPPCPLPFSLHPQPLVLYSRMHIFYATMKTENLIIFGGLAAAGYYVFVHKPQQQIKMAYAGGAGAVGAIGTGINDFISGLFSGFRLPILNAAAAGQQQALLVARERQQAEAEAQAQVTWKEAGGRLEGRAFIMPKPLGQIYGLTVQQPAITKILAGLAAQGQGQPLATVTTLQDVVRVQATRQQEAVIKREFPEGSQVVGHRVQAGADIYTVKSPSGQITIVRR